MELVEIAITLGIKKELRNLYTREQLVERIYELFDNQDTKYIIFSLEDYATSGIHAHIYYFGKQIYWKSFNTRWGLGYVKNVNVYDKEGWIKYITKKGVFWEKGIDYKSTANNEISVIEILTGKSLFDTIKHYEQKTKERVIPEELLTSSSNEDNFPM